MNKTLTCVGVTAITLVCGSYLFMDKNTDERYQSLSSESQGSATLNNSLSSSASQPNVNFDQNEAVLIQAEKTKPEANTLIRHYSHTFLDTAAYEAASRFGNLPAHMRDVHLKELPFDEHGHLIIDENTKQLIEFFLLAKNIEGIDQATARLYEYLDLTLPSPANEQARAIAEQYLSYKEQLNNQQFSDNTNLSDESRLADIQQALTDRKQLRRQILGEQHSQTLFAYEEQYEDFSFTRLQINANKELSAEEKNQQLALAEQSLPEDLSKKMRYKRETKNLESKINTLKQTPGNEAEIYDLRKDFYGEKVAERLAYLEDSSPAWQQRVIDFYQEKLTIQQNPSFTEEQKDQQIKTLMNQLFSYKEQVKIAVQSIRG